MAFKTARNSFIKIVPRGGKKARARVTSIQTKPFRFAGWPCVLCPRGIKIIVLKMNSGILLFRKKPLRIYNLHLLKLRDFGRTIYSIGFLYCWARCAISRNCLSLDDRYKKSTNWQTYSTARQGKKDLDGNNNMVILTSVRWTSMVYLRGTCYCVYLYIHM